jgi:hypothetical protein
MILSSTTTSERGKPVQKTANEYIKIILADNRMDMYQVDYYTGNRLMVKNIRTQATLLDTAPQCMHRVPKSQICIDCVDAIMKMK